MDKDADMMEPWIDVKNMSYLMNCTVQQEEIQQPMSLQLVKYHQANYLQKEQIFTQQEAIT